MSAGFGKIKLPENKIQKVNNDISTSSNTPDTFKISYPNLYNNNLLNGCIWAINTHVEEKVFHLHTTAYKQGYVNGLVMRFEAIADAFDKMYVKLNNLNAHAINKSGLLSFKKGDTVFVRYNSNNRVFSLHKIIPSKRSVFSPEQVKDFNKLTYSADFITSDLDIIKNSPINIPKIPVSVKVINFDSNIIQEISFIDVSNKKSYFSRSSKFNGTSWSNWENSQNSNLDPLIFKLQKPLLAEDIDGSTVIIKSINSNNNKLKISENKNNNLQSFKNKKITSKNNFENNILDDNFDPYNDLEVNDQLQERGYEQENIEYSSDVVTDSFDSVSEAHLPNDHINTDKENIEIDEINNEEHIITGKTVMNKSNKSTKLARLSMHSKNNFEKVNLKKLGRQVDNRRRKDLINASLHIKKPITNDENQERITPNRSSASEKLRNQILKLSKNIQNQSFSSSQHVSNSGNIKNNSISSSKDKQSLHKSVQKKFILKKAKNNASKNTIAPFSVSTYKDLLENKSNSKVSSSNFQKTGKISVKSNFSELPQGNTNRQTISSFNKFSNNNRVLSNSRSGSFLKPQTNSNFKKIDFSSIKTNYSNVNNSLPNSSFANYKPNNISSLRNNWSFENNRLSSVRSKFSQNINSYSTEKMQSKSRITIANLSPTIG